MSDRFGPADPRPVAETPVAALVAGAPDLAKRWLIALIAATPLEHADRLPVAALARDAPDLCAQVVRALADDDELRRLRPDGAMSDLAARAGRLAGAEDPGAAVAAVEALRDVIWRAVLVELREPSATVVAELASRLAHVCATVTAAVVGTAATPRVTIHRRVPGEAAPEGAPAVLAEDARSTPRAEGPLGGEGPAAWIGSIGRRLERYADDHVPFAVLLIEVRDIERLAQAETGDALARITGEVERALGGELRPADALTREGLGRYWLVTPDTDEPSGRMLAERLAHAVASSTGHRGSPLHVTIGTAVCPADGTEPAALAARADMDLYAARAAGRATAPLR